MSIQAIVWVLEEAPITKPSHVPVLLSLANEADSDGKGAFPSQRTMAWQTRKTERAVRKDLDCLEEEGLIQRGDQARAAYIPADRRPIVWNLAMERTRDMSKRPNPRPASGWDGKQRATDDVDRAEPGGTTVPPDEKPQVKTGGTTVPGGTTGSDRGELQGQTGGNHSSADPLINPTTDTHTSATESTGTVEPAAETRVCEFSEHEINQMKGIIYAAVAERATGAVEIPSTAQLYDLLDHAKQCWALDIDTDTIEDTLNRRINDKTQYPYRIAREQLKTLINRTKEPSFLPGPRRGKTNSWVDEDGFEWPHHAPYARECGGQSCSDYQGKRYVAIEERLRDNDHYGSVGAVVPIGDAFSCPICKAAYKKETATA